MKKFFPQKCISAFIPTGLHGEDDEDAGHDPRAVVVLELEPQLGGQVVRVQRVCTDGSARWV